MSNPNIFISAKVLKIPVHNTEQQVQSSQIPKQKLISQFAAQFKCSNFEAKQYLEENDYDLEKATAARNEKIKPKEEDSTSESAPRIGGLTIHNAKYAIFIKLVSRPLIHLQQHHQIKSISTKKNCHWLCK